MARAADRLRRLLAHLVAGAGLAGLLGACPPAASSVTCQKDEECLAGSFCVDTKCVTCPKCSEGQACVRGSCLPRACGDEPCHQGEVCRGGRCLSEVCLALTCPAGEACARGACYPVDCSGVTCGAASVCADEKTCTVNACAGVTCGASEACADGTCRPQSCAGVVCATGAVCEQERCVESTCVGVVCGGGTLCDDGRCKPVRCAGAAADCPADEVCEGGTCRDLRCEGLTCPSGRTCSAAACVSCETWETSCTDGVDEDCNAATDCTDPACVGVACDDGDPGSVDDACTAEGACAGSTVSCNKPPDDCHQRTGVVNPTTGRCDYPLKAAGTACAASGPCVSGGKCDSQGDCKATTADCSASQGPCWGTGSCNATTNQCEWPPLGANTACDDGDRCTVGDACDGLGACRASNVSCTTPPGSCWERAGACNPGTGQCDYAFKPPGTACKETLDLCTVGDACDGFGRCVPGPEKTCPSPPNECQDPGSCHPTTGDCVYPNKADGTVCTSNYCLTCTGGQCVTVRADGTHIWGAAVCCGGVVRDTAADPAHCGGCDSPCGAGHWCESVDQTPACNPAPAGTSGRCSCYSNLECPRGQVCRTYTPYTNRCTPNDGNGCFSGQYQDISGCPNYCIPHCASGLGVPEPWLGLAIAALQLTRGLRRRRGS